LISHNRTIHTIDFSAVTVEELQNFDIDFVFKIDRTGEHHRLSHSLFPTFGTPSLHLSLVLTLFFL